MSPTLQIRTVKVDLIFIDHLLSESHTANANKKVDLLCIDRLLSESHTANLHKIQDLLFIGHLEKIVGKPHTLHSHGAVGRWMS